MICAGWGSDDATSTWYPIFFSSATNTRCDHLINQYYSGWTSYRCSNNSKLPLCQVKLNLLCLDSQENNFKILCNYVLLLGFALLKHNNEYVMFVFTFKISFLGVFFRMMSFNVWWGFFVWFAGFSHECVRLEVCIIANKTITSF